MYVHTCTCLLNKFTGKWLYVSFDSHTSWWQNMDHLYSHRTCHYTIHFATEKFIKFNSIQTVSNNILYTLPQSATLCIRATVLIWEVASYNVHCTEIFEGKGRHYALLKSILPPPPELGLNKELALNQQLHCHLKYCPSVFLEIFFTPMATQFIC